jgi:hypothetical protein
MPPPAQPILVSPADLATGQLPNGLLTWNAASGADDYDVYLDIVDPPVVVVSPGQTGLTYAYAGLTPGVTYYWKVRANNVGGWTDSDVWEFTILPLPGAPTLVSPADGALDQPLAGTLTWTAGASAAYYDVYLYTGGTPVQVSSNQPGLTYAYSGLLVSTLYEWYVVAQNAVGEAASATWDFTTTATPPIPGGWYRCESMPSGTKPVKDGGWLLYHGPTKRIYASKGNKTSDFYSWDADAETVWTKQADYLTADKLPYKGSFGCTDNDTAIWATRGNNTYDFYRYSIGGNAWTALSPVPEGLNKVKGGTGMAYVNKDDTAAYVYFMKGYKTDFYKYDIVNDTFLPLENAPTGAKAKWDKGSFVAYDGEQYIYAAKAKYNELWRYDVYAEAWEGTARAPMPLESPVTGKTNKKLKDGGSAAFYDGHIYAFKGGNTQQWWRYDVSGDSWHELESIPQVGYTGEKKKKVKAGAGVALDTDKAVFYALKGNKSNQFWKYVPGTAVFYAARPERDGVQAGAVSTVRNLTLAPNPLASGFATLRYTLPRAGAVGLSITDVTGRQVMTRTLTAGRTGTLTLDLRQLSAGVYLVKVTGDSYTVSQKLVVER